MKEASRKLRVRPLLCGLAVLTSFALSGCASAELGTRNQKQAKVFVIGQSEGIQFWDSVEQGARDAAEEFTYELHYANAKSIADVEGQIDLVNDAIRQQADVIVIALNDTEALKAPLEAAQNAGIKIMTLNADFAREDSDRRTAFVGTNNFISGQIAGKHVVDAYEDPVNDKALIVAHSGSASSATMRVGGFRSIVESTIAPLAGQARAAAAQAAAQAAALAAAQAAQEGEGAGGPPEGAGGPPEGVQGGPPAGVQGDQGGAPEGAGGPPAGVQGDQGGAPEGAGGPPAGVQGDQGGAPEGAGGPPPEAQGDQGGAPEGAGGPPEGADSMGEFSAIAGQEVCKGDVSIAKDQTVQFLQEHPEVKIVLATNESSTLGVCQAIQEMDFEPDDLTVIGFNANDAEIQYLRAGILDGLVVQNPYNMGYLSVYYAGQLAAGQSIAANIDTGVTFVTAENLDNDDIQLILDPKKYLNK